MATKNLVLRTIYIDPDVDDQLRTEAFDSRTSKNDLLRRYLRLGMETARQYAAVQRAGNAAVDTVHDPASPAPPSLTQATREMPQWATDLAKPVGVRRATDRDAVAATPDDYQYHPQSKARGPRKADAAAAKPAPPKAKTLTDRTRTTPTRTVASRSATRTKPEI